MKALAFGDLHSHPYNEWSEVDDVTGNSRLTNILKCLDDMKSYAIKNGIKYVLFAGDLFHKRKAIDVVVFNLTYQKILEMTEAGLIVVMIPGNHDQVDNSDFPVHSLESFKEIMGVVILDRFTPYELEDGYHVFPVPYSKNAEMVKAEVDKYAFTTVNEGIEDKSILLAHAGISGAFVGKSSYAMADAFTVEDFFPHAFRFGIFGHFHKGQDLGGHEHFFYTGAPIQGNFNDEGEDKGFTVIDMETGTREFVPIKNPKFMTIVVDELNDEVLKELEEKTKGNYVRYKVSANNVQELAEKLPEDSKHRMEVQKDFDSDKRLDIDISESYEDIIKKYAEEFNPEALAIGLEIFRDSQTK